MITFSNAGYEKRVNGIVVASGLYTLHKESAKVNGQNVDYRIEFADRPSASPASYILFSDNTYNIYYGQIAPDGSRNHIQELK